MIAWSNVPTLMLIYGIGFVSIFGLLWLMYRYALQKREELELTEIELLETQLKKDQQWICMLTGLISSGLAIIGIVFNQYLVGSFFAGIVYNLVWILMIPKVKKYKRELAVLLE